jgi:glycosyltransferase involved in cell wall biosynthesis
MANRKKGFTKRAYYATRSLFKFLATEKVVSLPRNQYRVKVAFIHNEKKISSGLHTGAAQINKLMARALAEEGALVQHFYPRDELLSSPVHLRGITNIIFFYSLLAHKDKILSYDVIQGTTYTPLPFLSFSTPVVCHFGSTIRGFLDSVPKTKSLLKEEISVFKELVALEIIPELDFKTTRPMEDIADIEVVAAAKATACIATSEKVKEELLAMGIPKDNVRVIHNAIEDYWYTSKREVSIQEPHLVFLGRLGGDVFTLKLKGFSRLVNLYRAFPDMKKTTICMTSNRKLKEWLRVAFPKHYMYTNLRKDLIPGALAPLYGSILFLSSRYEGFSLSLIEGMSQGLVPITFAVGVAPEIIEHGKNGFIVKSEKEAEMFVRELTRDQDKRLAMARAAQETSLQFTSTRIAKNLIDLYQEIKSEHRAKRKNGSSADTASLPSSSM